MTPRLQIEGLEAFSAMVDALLGIDLQEAGEQAITEATAILLNRVRTNFLEQRSPSGEVWEPSYAAYLRSFGLGRNPGGGGTLFDTGTLFNSIQAFSISPLEQSIATDVFYAPYHNFGTAVLPQREFLGFSQEDYDIADAALLNALDLILESLS